jgi:hypothetical protein
MMMLLLTKTEWDEKTKAKKMKTYCELLGSEL